jgi:hypothetical protein
MKQTENKNIRRVFPFQFNLLGILLCVLALLLCATGVGISVYRIIANGISDFTDTLQSPFLIAVSLFCAAVVISILAKSEYIVTDEELITRFGFIKSKISLSAITAIEHDRTAQKLAVYCGEEFTVLTLKPEWADDFTHEICAANPDIAFSFTMTENTPPDDTQTGGDKTNNKQDK